jgi:class 3 adenylate cyclase
MIDTRYESTELVFAILSVAGATAACARHGDVLTVETLTRYYSLVADTIRPAEGRVIKVIGDGIIATYPFSHPRAAVDNLRLIQERGTHLWQLFDQRCRVQAKVGIGSLVCGLIGPPGEEREDLYGDALNQLFKLPPGDLVVSRALARVVGR